MTNKNEAAAESAAAGDPSVEEIEAQADDQSPSDLDIDIPAGDEGVEIIDVRESALEEIGEIVDKTLHTDKSVAIGDDVYFGRGDGHFYAAKVTEIHEDSNVDLVVFERERVYHVFNIAKAELGQPGCINGWAVKA